MLFWLFTGLISLIALLAWLLIRQSYRDGRQDERHENDTQRMDTARKAARIRDRLVHDTDFARRVRDRFSR